MLLRKTKNFVAAFRQDLRYITIPPYGILFKGSYKLKNIGAVITDIDLNQFVVPDKKFIENLQRTIKSLSTPIASSPTPTSTAPIAAPPTPFTFIKLQCGRYKELTVPWEVDGRGGCVYNYEQAIFWLNNIKNIIDPKTYTYIYEKISDSKTTTLKDLIDIEDHMKKYWEIEWDEKDILTGYKIFNNTKYILEDEMAKGNLTIVKYIYKYTSYNINYYIGIDVGLIVKNTKQIGILKSYYKKQYYKIFKFYKLYIKDEYKNEYLEALVNLEKYTGLLHLIHTTNILEKYSIVSQDEINRLKNNYFKLANDLNINITERSSIVLEETLDKIISDISYEYLLSFSPDSGKLKYEIIRELELHQLRAEEASWPMLVNNNRNTDDDKGCPFFAINVDNFEFLYDTAKRILLSPSRLLRCIYDTAKKHSIPANKIIQNLFPKNRYRTIWFSEKDGNVSVHKAGKNLGTYPKAKLASLQRLLIDGKILK